MKKNVILFLSFLLTIEVVAQQLPQYSQYARNQFMINPGAAGIYNTPEITLSTRMQWVGFENAPKTSYLSFNTIIGKQKGGYNPGLRSGSTSSKISEVKTGKLKHAIGVQLFSDQYGAFQKINLSGTYSIHLPLSKNVNLSFGTKLDYNNNSFNKNKAVVLDQVSDQFYNVYSNSNLNRNILNLGSGLFLYSHKFYGGLSVDNLTKDIIHLDNNDLNFDTKMHFKIIAGYKFPINNDFILTPSFLIQYMNPVISSKTFTFQLDYKKNYWVGLSFRMKDAIVGMAGINVKKRFKIGYSFDMTISNLRTLNSGGHEIVLCFNIN